jgi:hypothetical protein
MRSVRLKSDRVYFEWVRRDFFLRVVLCERCDS